MAARKEAGWRRGWGMRALVEGLESRMLLSSDILSNHGTAGSTGLVSNETVLTPGNVLSTLASSATTTNFGRLFDTTVDGQVYAQVLAKGNVNITRGVSQGIHNVLYVATNHDSLYAIDANTGVMLWQDNFTQIGDPRVVTVGSPVSTAGVTTIPNGDLLSSTVSPELGVLSTPAMDGTTGILYLLANTKEFRSGTTPVANGTVGADRHYVQRLWAINISNGNVAISGSNGAFEPASGGQVVGDTIKNDTISTTNYANYTYVAGPYIRGTGNNQDTFNADGSVATTDNADGWISNATIPNSTPWGTASTPSATGYIAFNTLLQRNRVGVTLVNGEVFLGYASHGDNGPYYGWLLGYSAATLANNIAFVTDPTFDNIMGPSKNFNSPGGLWASGGPIATDGTYLYFTVGNGAFNPAVTNFSASYVSNDHGNVVQMPIDGDYGDCLLKVAIDPNATQANVNLGSALTNPTPDGTYNPDGGYNVPGYGLKVVDYFTPSNVYELNVADLDLGSGGVLVIPSTGAGSATAANGDPMLAVSSKEGRVYLLDANNLGGFNTAYDVAGGPNTTAADPAPFDRVIGEYYYPETVNSAVKANSSSNEAFDTPAWFNGVFYVCVSGAPEFGFTPAGFAFNPGISPRTGVEPVPVFSTASTTGSFGVRGTTATVSANGVSNGIVWNINAAGAATDAMTAYTSAGTLLFSSGWKISGQSSNTTNMLENGVSGATSVKFSLPTVFNGMVYAATGGATGSTPHGTVVGYGLLGTYLSNNSLMTAPSNLTTLRTGGGVQLNWARHSVSETETELDRSTDGTNWSVLTYVANGANGYVDATAAFPTQYFYRVRAVSGLTLTAFTNSATAPAVLMGDANVDGHVDSADASIVLNNFGTVTSNWTSGNFDGAATIDLTDLAAVLNHFGSSSSIGGGAVEDGGQAVVVVADVVPDVAAVPVAASSDGGTAGNLPVDTTLVTRVGSVVTDVAVPVSVVTVTPVAAPAVNTSKKPVKPVKAVPAKHASPPKPVVHFFRGRRW